jgi:geranylgeranylglycerol-phosphate geranylgeranyltransferase
MRVNTFVKIRDMIALIRPHNCLIALTSVLAGAFLASGQIGRDAALASVMAFFVCAGAYVLNDLYDVKSDAINKPGRPLAAGRLSRESAGAFLICLWAPGLGFAILGGRDTVLFAVGWMAALWLYSWKLKALGIAGHIAVSAVASSGFLLGALAGGDGVAGLIPFSIALLFHLAREIAKGVSDVRGDRAAGTATLAVRLGAHRSLKAALWCIGGIILLSLLPVVFHLYGYLYLLPVLLVVYPLLVTCVLKIVRAGSDAAALERASAAVATLLKAAMPAGLVAFFLAGV